MRGDDPHPLRVLLLTLALALCASNPAGAADVPPAMDRFDGHVEPNMDGVVVTTCQDGCPGAEAGIRPGDLVLAIDGWRVHDVGEVLLASRREAEPPLLEHVAILRDGQLIEVDLHDLAASGKLGVSFQIAKVDDGLGKRLHDLGAQLTSDEADALDHIPVRASHALRAWADARTAAAGDLGWARRFADDYLHILHGDGAPAAGPVAIPVPLLARLDRLYRAIGTARGPGGADPDPSALGEDPRFVAEFHPYPWVPMPAMGRIATKDPVIAEMLALERADPAGSGDERANQASTIINQLGMSTPEDYLGQVEGSLIDDLHQGGWPYRSVLVWADKDRAHMEDWLRAQLAGPRSGDDLLSYALLGPLAADGKIDEAARIIADLETRSPYLAWRALRLLRNAAIMRNAAKLPLVDALIAQNRSRAVPKAVEVYDYCLKRSRELSNACVRPLDYNERFGVPALFRVRPDLVCQSLLPNAAASSAARWESALMCKTLSRLAWSFATDPMLANGDQSRELAEQLRQSGGWLINANLREVIAACWARAGDFDKAQHWLAASISMQLGTDHAKELADRLAHYALHQLTDGGEPAASQELTLPLKAGGSCTGRYTQQPIGCWRFYRADGSLAIIGCYDRQGAPIGVWRTIDAKGNPQQEMTCMSGMPCGRYRAWGAEGELLVLGWYSLETGSSTRVGTWDWLEPGGAARDSGVYIDGQRSGTWACTPVHGAPATMTTFTGGTPQGAWPGVERPRGPEFPFPPVPQAPQPASAAPQDDAPKF